MVLSFLLTIFSTYFLASLFGSFVYIFPVMLGLIILNIEILSLFKSICPFSIILLNILTLGLILTLWIKKGRPVLKPDVRALKEGIKRFLNCFKLDKSFIILGAGMAFLMASAFILSAFLPVNEPDALTYHTYRALVWAQKGFICHFDTIDSRNLVMPINSEIIYTWIFSLTGKDFGFGLVQYITSFFTISGLWMLLSRLKISYRKRLWTIFIFFSFAGVISQISSTQTDLLVGTLLLYSMIFFYDYVNIKINPEEKKLPSSAAEEIKETGFKIKETMPEAFGHGGFIKGYFSSLCFAIALGIKSTGFIAGFPLLILFFIYAYKKRAAQSFLWFFAALSLNFVLFSSYNYILNFIDYSNPFGSQISINRHKFFGGLNGFIANFVRYNIQLLDFSGFTWGIYLSELIFKIQDGILSVLNISPDEGIIIKMEGLNSSLAEQAIGYGVTGILAFIPCVLIGAFKFIGVIKNFIQKKSVKENRLILYTLAILFYINLVMLSFAIGYMVYSIRFICTFILLSAPVLAFLYFKKNNFYKGIVIAFAMFYFCVASLYLASRPFLNLIKSYNASISKESFMQDTRCMKYGFFKKKKKSCEIDENILSQIEDYKTVGIFPDIYVMMQLSTLNAQKRHIKLEQLIIPRIDTYNIEKYDYILTPEPFQTVTDFNKQDEKVFLKYGNMRGCFHFANDNKTGKLIEDREHLKELYIIKCITPEIYIKDKGFSITHKIQTRWKDIVTNEDTVSSYVLWKNMK